MRRRQQQQPITAKIIIISFVGLYLITCIWSVTTLSKDDGSSSSSSCGNNNDNNNNNKIGEDDLWRRSLRKLPLSDTSEISSSSSSKDELLNGTSTLTTKQYNFTAAICVCVKDAEAYLEEFIDYHLLAMKFANIYIYDDSPNFELERWYHHTRSHPIYQRVEILHLDNSRDPHKNQQKKNQTEESGNDDDEDDDEDDDDEEEQTKQQQQQQPQIPIDPQTDYYEDCVQRFGFQGPKHDYFAFIDIDEFFVLMDDATNTNAKYKNILDVLQDYLVPFGGALTVNWMLVGSANKSVYAPLPVTKRFQYRDDKAHFVIKSIVKTSDYLGHRNPHAVYVRDSSNTSFTTDHTSNIHTTAYPGAIHKYASTPRGATDKTCPSKVILLYHYRYTSEKEYIFKRCTRGGTDGGHYWCDGGRIRQGYGPKHIQSIPGTVFDDKAWKFLTLHVPKYKLYESFEDFH